MPARRERRCRFEARDPVLRDMGGGGEQAGALLGGRYSDAHSPIPAAIMRFVGLALHDPVPDAKTIWLYREQLTRAGALGRAFGRFDAMLRDRGYLAMGGQIVDATVIDARRPRLTRDEKQIVRDGGMPGGWSKARTRQIDRGGRWTIKRGRKQAPPEGAPRQASSEIAVPVFGYKNHLDVDRAHGFIRRFVVTHAARHDGSQLGALLDADNTASDVWAELAKVPPAQQVECQRRGIPPIAAAPIWR